MQTWINISFSYLFPLLVAGESIYFKSIYLKRQTSRCPPPWGCCPVAGVTALPGLHSPFPRAPDAPPWTLRVAPSPSLHLVSVSRTEQAWGVVKYLPGVLGFFSKQR